MSTKYIDKALKNSGLEDLLDKDPQLATTFKKFEDELTAHLNELDLLHNALLNYTPCTISWIRGDLTYREVNKTLAQIWDKDPKEFFGKSIGFLTGSEYLQSFAKEIFSSPQNVFYKDHRTIVEGEEKFFWFVANKFNEDKDAIIIGVDVTELKLLERQLHFSEKLGVLGRLAAGIMHEINNPLQVIALAASKMTSLLRKEELDRDEFKKMIDKVTKMATLIQKIIKGLKNFIRHGDDDPLENHPLKTVVKDAIEILHAQIHQSDIDVQIIEKETVSAEINYTQLTQVFLNMIQNAMDAQEDEAEKWIKIYLSDLGEEVEIRFVNGGEGIPPDIERKLFEAFFTTKKVGKGTGLGLSICSKIVEDGHRGRLEYLSDEEETTFSIVLPKKGL